MPGVLIVEAMAQAAVILYGLSVDEDEEQRRRSKFLGKVDMRFIRPAYPGDQLVIDLRVIRLLEGAIALKGKVTVRGKPVTKGELIVMQPRQPKENQKDV
jgi:3-hydroxyacyl-[acyl-carrier-protein] dehydratase